MFMSVDFVIFGIFLSLSMVVGLYHGVKSRMQRKTLDHSEATDFLTGGRQLPILPVCLSLLTTFISGIALIGLPAEIYQRGIAMGASFIGGALSFLLSGMFFVPIFYKLQFISIYEYLEMRFDSKLLRKLGSTLFLIATLFYMAVVMYAPSIALSGATNVQLWPLILSIGVVSTIYTALGGIKAVIWTDTLQAVFMYAGLGTLLIKGTIDAGGFWNVYNTANDSGRLWSSIFKFDPSILQYNSFWITTLGGVMHWTCFYGLNQMALQRYCSMPSLKDARVVMAITVPAFWAIGIMCSFLGILSLAYFHGCDPVAIGEIDSIDQMIILLAGRVLSILPGLPGLFLASLYSSTLSSTSSGMNSMTAVLFEDFLKERCQKVEEKTVKKWMQIVTIVIGIVSTLLAFACDYMGGIFNAATTTLGAVSGPLVGLLFLGVFFPRANKIGAYAGLVTALIIICSCCIGYNIQKPYRDYVLPLQQNANNPNCRDLNANASNHHLYHISALKVDHVPHPHALHPDWHYGDPDALFFARISPFTYAGIGVSTVVVIGAIVSLIFPVKLDERKQKFADACTYVGRHLEVDRNTYRLVETDNTDKMFLDELN